MASSRKSFPLRISKEVYDEVKTWAEQEMRSVNGQIEFLLKQAIVNRKKQSGGLKKSGTDKPKRQ